MHCSCHGKNTRCMSKIVCNTILGKFTLDAVSRATHSGSIRASSLDHKSVDDTMEDQSVIEAILYKTDKVIDSVWCDFRI